MLRFVSLLSTALLALLSSASAYAQAQSQGQAAPPSPPSPLSTTDPAAFVRPPAPGRLIEVSGRRLHLDCKGEAGHGPAVVFEAGLSQFTSRSTHGAVQEAIATFARVCIYDRAGLGWSDPAPADWTLERMADDLHALWAASGEPKPFVIVAHSFGGLVARVFARRHPDDLVGLILLDATSDEDWDELAAGVASTRPQLDAALASSTPGRPVIGLPLGTSPEVVMAFTPEILRGVKTEFEALDRLPASAKRPGGFGTLGDLPLVVIRRGKTETPPSAEDLRHQKVQENLAKLSTQSELVVAQRSGHTISLDEPSVVVDSVRRLLDAVRPLGAPGAVAPKP